MPSNPFQLKLKEILKHVLIQWPVLTRSPLAGLTRSLTAETQDEKDTLKALLRDIGWDAEKDAPNADGSYFEIRQQRRKEAGLPPLGSEKASATAVEPNYVGRDQFIRPEGLTHKRLDTTLKWTADSEEIILQRDDLGHIQTNVAWSVYGGNMGFGFNQWEPSYEFALNVLNQVVPPGEDERAVVDFESPYWDKSHVNFASHTAADLYQDFANEVLAKQSEETIRLKVADIKTWIAEKQKKDA